VPNSSDDDGCVEELPWRTSRNASERLVRR